MTSRSLTPNDTALLSVFYDGSCALCSAEMTELARLDTGHELALIDCARADFDDTPYRAEGVDRDAMLANMHVRDALGDWHRGVDAFALMYATVGAPTLARLWAHPLTRPFTRRLYPWVVRHRHTLSALGINRVLPKALRLFAGRRAPCAHGACQPIFH